MTLLSLPAPLLARVSLDDRSWRAVTALICGGFLLWTYASLRSDGSPSYQDTEAFLGHSLYIAEHGGWWGFLVQCFTGEFPITERHPLNLLLWSTFASRELQFFTQVRLLNLLLGAVALLVVLRFTAARFGRGPALLAGLALALSNAQVAGSAHVTQEPLFVLCTMFTWWYVTTGDVEYDARTLTRRWALGGLWLGLAWLTKSPAILLGVAIVATGLWHERLAFLRQPRLWALVAAATLVSSPLLIRNLVGFGTPLYEGVNSNITWIDKWSELGEPHSHLHYDRYGIMTIEKNGLPDASQYLATHGWRDIASRLAGGFVNELVNVVPTSLGPQINFLSPAARRLAGAALLLLALAGWWRNRRRPDATLLFMWSGAFLVFFSWDRMFPEPRYLAPLVPLWLAYAGWTAWTLLSRFLGTEAAGRGVVIATAVVAAGAGAWICANGSLVRPEPAIRVSPSYARLLEWMNGHVEPGDRMVIGPSREFYGLLWTVQKPVTMVQAPSTPTLSEYQAYLADRDVRYIVMDPQNARGNFGFLKAALERYFDEDADGSLIEKQALPGWRPVYRDPGKPSRFVIYEATSRPPRAT